MPKVSVIINCHNGEKYLKEAIDSVFAQTFQDWEIIFFDNASTDGSALIAQSYDGRVRYTRNENLITLGAARKEAVLYASGEWVAFLDTDDRWCPEKLEAQINALQGTDYIFCYAGIQEITADGEKIRDVYPLHASGELLESLLNQFEVNMVTPMFKREAALKYGVFFEPGITASEEYNFFVRLAARGRGLVQSLLLGQYRVYQGSLTDRQISKWAVERRFTLRQLRNENPGIDNKYPSAFAEAAARAAYYEARYLMASGKRKDAVSVMASVSNLDFRYRFLLYSLFIPGAWNILHSATVKRRLAKAAAKLSAIVGSLNSFHR